MAEEDPALEDQQAFWDGWNTEWRHGALDSFMSRQRDAAVAVAAGLGSGLRVIEAGCGTGWLSNELTSFGETVATDISPAAIEFGKANFPDVDLRCADFVTADLTGPFDLAISADALAHIYDQPAYVARIARLLRPGGTFLLMTQNAFVWNRRSRHIAYGGGQIEQWPSLRRIRGLLGDSFEISSIGSLVPGGDRGVLFWVENRWVRGGMGKVIGARRWERLLERARLGRELVITAVRR